MDFQAAINAHVGWKIKLSKYLRQTDGSLDPRAIERDDACDLGRWMRGEGADQCGDKPVFLKLRADHAKFHKAAADIVRKANAGQKVSSETALGAHSPFSDASSSVVSAIMELRRNCT